MRMAAKEKIRLLKEALEIQIPMRCQMLAMRETSEVQMKYVTNLVYVGKCSLRFAR